MAINNSIKVEVHFSPVQTDEMHLKDKNVVIVDVLRSSASIATAFHHGAKEIIPVNNIESAVKISGSLFSDVTLRAGERNGKMIEGFNLGNSPREYTEKIVKGKSIILMTSNGSVAMVKGRYAKNLIVAGFINLSAVVSFLKQLQSDFIIICAGKENKFCIEDAVCAGRIITQLQHEIEKELMFDDAGAAAVALHKNLGKNILKMLKMSEHGKYLSDIGFVEDLNLCAAIDSFHILPILSGNVLRVYKENSKRP
ncbi:MAG: 2-phosphosulfolactate phosphatase [Ignavibacteriae bacterium]|nr:2-phosphosulfolactate phosphatase [Ignavibacteriota bacterium]